MEVSKQSMKEKNLNALVEYFQAGCKKEQMLGLELEHFVVNRDTRFSATYESGLEEILTRLQPLYGAPIFSDGRLIGISRAASGDCIGAEITLEPAAQLEISINPTSCLQKIRNTYDHFLHTISPILHSMNYELFCAGYHPRSKIADMPLIPKKRYALMDEYFKTTGTMGANMMRGTAATQINIDYESEADFKKKFYVANFLGPFFSFMYDNTKIFEGEPFDGRMLRSFIWKNVDAARSKIVPGALGGNFGFRDYAEYIYNMPPIFILRDGETIPTGNKTVGEIFAETLLSPADIEHVLSMAFPDVRLKNRIEIRMVDSLLIEKALEFTALIKKIFYEDVPL
jgi:glutamate--cysteine ligase